MGKLTHLKKALDMSKAARMRRAAEQGFDVDAPLYRGSPGVRGELGRKRNWDKTWKGHYSSSAENASTYAGKQVGGDDALGGGKVGASIKYRPGSRVTPVYIKSGGYFEVDAQGANFNEIPIPSGLKGIDGKPWTGVEYAGEGKIPFAPIDHIAERARDNGYRGVVVKNVVDTAGDVVEPADTVIAFNPEDIKSVHAAFDPDDSSFMGYATPGAMATAGAAAAFIQRRNQKRDYWQAAKGLAETAATVGSGMIGGAFADLSRVGGYLNPFMPVERTEEGAQAIQNALTYQPSQAAAPYLQGIGSVIETGIQDIERGLDQLNVDESIPAQIYESLPERARGIVRSAGDLLF